MPLVRPSWPSLRRRADWVDHSRPAAVLETTFVQFEECRLSAGARSAVPAELERRAIATPVDVPGHGATSARGRDRGARSATRPDHLERGCGLSDRAAIWAGRRQPRRETNAPASGCGGHGHRSSRSGAGCANEHSGRERSRMHLALLRRIERSITRCRVPLLSHSQLVRCRSGGMRDRVRGVCSDRDAGTDGGSVPGGAGNA